MSRTADEILAEVVSFVVSEVRLSIAPVEASPVADPEGEDLTIECRVRRLRRFATYCNEIAQKLESGEIA